MKFYARHKQALIYFAGITNDRSYHAPHGVGETTMRELAKNGYVLRERAWTGYTYKITDKGRDAVGQWTPDAELKRLEKWNNAVRGNKK
jgi:hypothetical protein